MMDGQAENDGVTGAYLVTSEDNEGVEYENSGLETAYIGANMEQLHAQEDDFEQPDGQRNSLSLDDDGGTHFDFHSQECVVRRTGAIRDASPTLQGASHDNDMMFNPLQRLNFDDEAFVDDDVQEDDDAENEDDEVDNEDCVEAQGHMVNNISLGEREYMHHRPAVNGSDLAEQGACGGGMLAHDQGQNIRIIEGHDSSLLDDGGNSPYGFNFLQTQMIQLPAMSPVGSGHAHNSRLEDESHNLYDSLEREDGAHHYEDSDENVLENNTSEYFSAGSMTLMAANSHGPDSDALWAQDENSDHGTYLTHSQQHFQHSLDPNNAQQLSPPRNFQVEAVGIFGAKRRGGAFMGEGNMGGYGDTQSNEEDNTDALSLELSEEGLLQNTQTYAQPVHSAPTNSASCSSMQAGRGDLGHHHTHKDWNSNWPQANGQPGGYEVTENSRSLNSQPKNLARSQSLLKNEPGESHDEGDGVDTQVDRRQAGAGSSALASDQNQSAGDSIKAAKKPVNNKVQPRRPAVQGSASSGDNRRTGAANPRPLVQNPPGPVKKTNSALRPCNLAEKAPKGNTGVRSKNGGEPAKGNNGGLSSTANPQSRPQSGHTSASSHTLSNMASMTNVSTNSRVSGVGKESHMTSSTQGRMAGQVISNADNNYSSILPQREDLGPLEAAHLSTSNGSQSTMPQHSYPQTSHSFDRIRVSSNQHPLDLRASQSFNKPRSSCSSVHSSYQNLSIQGDHTGDSQTNVQNLPPRPNENHNRGNTSVGSHHRPPHQAYGGQGLPLQRTQSGFPIQPPYSQLGGSAGQDSSHLTYHSQMDGFKRAALKLPECVSQSGSHHGHLDNDIQGMEEVRGHLHSILHADISSTSLADHTGFDHSDASSEVQSSDQGIKRQLHFDTDLSSFIGNNAQDDMSDILENFPTFSSKMFLDMPGVSNRSETTIQGENQYLRDSLAKERYRRKHCEEHIQKLNAKLLEVQQQLAVAVSTDKRKDLMIEQLDKQLAKVVEGWKRREAEKDEFLRAVTKEKELIEDSLQTQQNMINNFERELAQTVDQLRAEKESSSHTISSLRDELYEAQREREHAQDVLEADREKFAVMTAEWNDLTDSRDQAEKRAQEAQERLCKEQEKWLTKEQELLAKITEVKEANQKVINMERVKLEEHKRKREEVTGQCEELKTELKKAILDMEQLAREKESQKVEMAIMEAKFESAQRKLEADLHSQMEKEIADQAAEFHARIETALEEASDRHRKQVSELNVRHQREMERLTSAMNEDRLKREEDCRKQLSELEEKLEEVRTENHSLRQSKIKLESQRMEILAKLQFMMQSQWNEAVTLLVSTPQKKSLNGSFLSSQSGGQLASAMAVTDGNTSVTSLNLVTSGPAALTGQGMEGHCREATSSPRAQTLADTVATATGGLAGREGEEINRMDRVEEYLQRLTHNMEIPMTRNDLQVSDLSREHISLSSTTAPSKLTLANPGGDHYQQGTAVSDVSASFQTHQRGFDFQNKLSNNLNQSQLPRVHGYVTGQTGKTLITTGGHVGGGHLMGGQRATSMQELSYQALAMRSPQQSSSRVNTDLSSQSSRTSVDRTPPTGHPYLINSSYGTGFAPTHLDPCSPSRPQERHFSPRHGPPRQIQNMSYSNSLSHQGRQLAGDYGDNKTVKVAANAAGNKNLYSPDSPTFTSSPSEVQSEHWSPGNAAASRPFFPNNSGTTASMLTTTSSPAHGGLTRSFDGINSPAKKYRTKPGQPPRISDSFNESLSPPVKQTADRQQGDNRSESGSSSHDPDRIQTDYSQLLDHMEDHHSRQGELQHYVRMLLQKAPGSVCSEPERDVHSDHDILESSRDLTVDLDLNDTATAIELTSQLARFQQLRESQQSSRTYPNQNGAGVQPHVPIARDGLMSHLSEFIGDNGVISTKGLSEISQLLSVYRDQWETNPQMAGQANVATQLMDALKDMASGSSSEGAEAKRQSKPPGGKQAVHNPPRKVRDLSKTKKVRSGSQSADSSINGDTREKSTVIPKPTGVQATGKKLPAPTAAPATEPGKEKKFVGPTTTTTKPPVGKGAGSGGPAWK
ncbi:unnamed protein product [Lymnaea stagnalis]|uniref:Centrobin n=1 Tax=Lymnaea stagnalis TaxID=6523 RepID=A0AAV2IP92_LYMST